MPAAQVTLSCRLPGVPLSIRELHIRFVRPKHFLKWGSRNGSTCLPHVWACCACGQVQVAVVCVVASHYKILIRSSSEYAILLGRGSLNYCEFSLPHGQSR